jgi:hypothetical protein
MRMPDAYWVLFKTIQERFEFERFVRPGLIHPLYGLPDPQGDYKYPEQSANERYWGKWFRELIEIDTALNRLDQAYIYLSHYPGGRAFPFQRLSEAEWIRYHVETYIQELYVLHHRLKRFLTKVERAAGAARDDAGVTVAQGLTQNFEKAFSNFVRIRSAHVHEFRFHDEEMSTLDLALLFCRAKAKLPMLRAARRDRYAAALNKWRKLMTDNNKNILSACVGLFEKTNDILVRNEPPRRHTRSKRPIS